MLTSQRNCALPKFWERELNGRALKYTHFELKNTVIQENKFPEADLRLRCTVVVF